MESRWRPFWIFSIIVLGVTAFFKLELLISSFSRLNFVDPVVAPLMVRDVVLLAIISEMLTVALLIVFKSDTLRAAIILWWCVMVLTYRHWFPRSKDAYCPCFGHLPEMLGLTSDFAALLARIIVQSLVVGSLIVIVLGPTGIYIRGLFRRTLSGSVRALLVFTMITSTCLGEVEKQTWELSGLVTRTTLNTGKDALSTESGWFRAFVDQSALAMHIVITNNPYNKQPRVLEYEYRTDGKHSVSFGRFDTNVVSPDDFIYKKQIQGKWLEVTNETPLKLDNSAHAILAPTPLPNEYTSHAIPIILAFGWKLIAPLYGSEKGPTLLDYYQSMRGEIQMLRYKATKNATSPVSGLSELLTFHDKEEATCDSFIASGHLPIDGVAIPERLEYRNFVSPKTIASLKISTNLGLQIVVVVTNAMPSSTPVPEMLAFADLTMADDRRFSLRNSDWVPAVLYTSTNRSLPTTARVMQQPFYENAVVQWSSSARQNKRRRIFFLVFGAFPAIMLGWWVIKQKQKQTKQES
jgi:hypothetical protein